MAELFGFTIQRSSKDAGGERTFSTPTPDDGTVDVAGGALSNPCVFNGPGGAFALAGFG